jgi:predicted nucleotidyltransferase
MKREEVLTVLQRDKAKIQTFGVRSLAIFGSVAREEADERSDIDILVEFSEPITFDRYIDLKFYLEDSLGVKVDLVTRKMLKPQLQRTVDKEAVYVT